MYFYDAFLKECNVLKNREEFNYWSAKMFVRQSADAKPKLNDIIYLDGLKRPYQVVGFSFHKPNSFEPVTDIIKFKLVA